MAMITEVPPVAILPNFVVQSRLLSKFRKQTGGTILVRVCVCVCACARVCVCICVCVSE